MAVPKEQLKGDKDLELRKAAFQGLTSLVTQKITQGACINGYGQDTKRTALHQAVIHGHFDVAAILLKAGADPSLLMLDKDQKTPLDYARTMKGRENFAALFENHLLEMHNKIIASKKESQDNVDMVKFNF